MAAKKLRGGKQAWSVPMWTRYLRAAKSAADADARRKAMHAEARREFVGELEKIADEVCDALYAADKSSGDPVPPARSVPLPASGDRISTPAELDDFFFGGR